jgi:hypothetical protein
MGLKRSTLGRKIKPTGHPQWDGQHWDELDLKLQATICAPN